MLLKKLSSILALSLFFISSLATAQSAGGSSNYFARAITTIQITDELAKDFFNAMDTKLKWSDLTPGLPGSVGTQIQLRVASDSGEHLDFDVGCSLPSNPTPGAAPVCRWTVNHWQKKVTNFNEEVPLSSMMIHLKTGSVSKSFLKNAKVKTTNFPGQIIKEFFDPNNGYLSAKCRQNSEGNEMTHVCEFTFLSNT